MKRRVILSALLGLLSMTEAAHALPVLGFLGGILAAGGIVTPLIGFGSIGVVNAGFAFATFLSSGFGSLLLSVGISAAQYFLAGKQKAPKIDSARITVRIPEPERWLHAGRVRAGGAVMFGEYDETGAFWFIVVHGDSIMVQKQETILDEIPVTFNNETDEDDGFRVETKEFTVDQKEGGFYAFQVWTRTYSEADPVPPPLAKFKAAFTAWTDDHKLAGTTYTICRIKPMKAEDRFKTLIWRGPIGLGEPAISIVADFSRIYDPRNVSHNINDPSTWSTTRNPVLIWAWFRTHRYGRNKPMSSINWDMVKIEADKCDVLIADKNADEKPRYECGISIPDSKERHVAESEILLSCDGIVIYDSEGKCYAKVGVYDAPTLTLSARRDILAMSSREAQDGETETDGVVVTYIDPEFNWTPQPAAPWKNPRYYVEGRVPKYLAIEILACQNHRQAVTLAKAIGEQSQPPYRLAPQVGLRGIKARRERIIDLQYDANWNGPHLIATPVEIDEAGFLSSFGVVPIDENHWTLLEGEEGDKPVPATPIEFDSTLALPSGVSIYAAPVPGSGGNSVRLEATFDEPPRTDYRYEFQYRKDGDLAWKPMVVLMDDLLAYSDTVEDAADYEVQYRTVIISGRASDWKTPPVSVTAIADTVAPLALSSFGAVGSWGRATLSFTTASGDAHLRAIAVYRVPTGVTLNKAVHTKLLIAASPGTSFSYIDGDATITNLLSNGDFASDTVWFKEADWTIAAGVGTKANSASSTSLRQTGLTLTAGVNYRMAFDITARTAGGFRSRLIGGTTVTGTLFSTVTRARDHLVAASGNNAYYITSITAAGSVDNAVLFAETPACAPQGVWDYYAFPLNGSGLEGPQATVVTTGID